jgi:hypothetical protein
MVCVTVCDCDCRLTNTTQSRAGSWTTRFHNRHNTTHFTPHPRGCRRGVPAEVDPRVIGHDVTSAQATSSSESAGSAGRAVNCVSFSRGQADTLGTTKRSHLLTHDTNTMARSVSMALMPTAVFLAVVSRSNGLSVSLSSYTTTASGYTG